MTYEEFSAYFKESTAKARREAEQSGLVCGQPVLCNGMDKDCEAYIFSDEFISGDKAQEQADLAVAMVNSDFVSV